MLFRPHNSNFKCPLIEQVCQYIIAAEYRPILHQAYDKIGPMISVGSLLLATIAVLLAVPSAVFAVEICAAVFLPPRMDKIEAMAARRARIAVLIPAHNEATGLLATLNDIRPQLHPSDRLLVVADNCTDDTAAVADSAGAETTVRTDAAKIGKGYALDWGINYLAADPPAILVIIDADCRVTPGAIDRLAMVSAQTQRPAQSLYLMTAPAGSTINHQVAEFAWRVKNWVRPLGLRALGLPCQLVGSGMAFPWDVIRSADLSTGFIVEDLKLGLELAIAGYPPIFCPSAVVTSTFPTTARGATTQRHRWEQGHIGLIVAKAPALLVSAARDRNKDLLALTLDLIVPPIVLLGLLLLSTVSVAGIATLAGLSLYAFGISVACALLVLGATILAWTKYARDVLPLKSFGLIVRYSAAKLGMYRAILLGLRLTRWIRADRS